MSNFDIIVDRANTGASKWDYMPEHIKKTGYPPLSVADMEFKCAESILTAIKEAADTGILGYTDPNDDYYNAVIGWFKRRHDWEIKKEWIVNTPGVVPALAMIVQEFTEKGDEILIQTPVYPPFFSQITRNDRVIVENPLLHIDGKYSIDFDDLAKKAARPSVKLMIISNPHNPVGRVFTRDELEKIGNICIKNNVLLVSDEIHCDLIHKPHRHIVMATISEAIAENTIICNSPSKSFNIAGLANANIMIPNEKIRDKFVGRIMKNGLGNIPYFSLCATIAAYNENEKWLDDMLAYVYENYLLLKKFFADNIPGVKISDMEGTYLAWADWQEVEPDKAKLEAFLLDKAYLVLGQGYTFGKQGECFERFNLALPRKTLIETLDRLRNAYKTVYNK